MSKPKKFGPNDSVCGNCAFFDKFSIQKQEDNVLGACHFNPPVPVMPDPYASDEDKQKQSKLGLWPLVLGNFWCGAFQTVKEAVTETTAIKTDGLL